MTVAEMNPIQLYCLIVFAFVICALGLLALREWPAMKTTGQRAWLGAGLFFIYGLPALYGLAVLRGL